MDPFIVQANDRFYATSEAYIVENAEQLPRELASEYNREGMNSSFVWIAGRFVQGGKVNRNGQFWSVDDIRAGEKSIRYTPMNALHHYNRPIGTIVETKIVHREEAEELLPEVQALGVLWAANFPEMAELARDAYAKKQLWWSMECVAEYKQCMTCERQFAWAAKAHETCEHLATSAVAPRRFINPTFLGGALIFPPERPGWSDADVTEVARELTLEYANEAAGEFTKEDWERLMAEAMA
jgi:hypothetical protein